MTTRDAQLWALVATAVAYVWHHIATARLLRLVARLAQVARAAMGFALAELRNADVVDLTTIKANALDKAKALLERLRIPWRAHIVALLEHELDLVAAELQEKPPNDDIGQLFTSTQTGPDASGSTVGGGEPSEHLPAPPPTAAIVPAAPPQKEHTS